MFARFQTGWQLLYASLLLLIRRPKLLLPMLACWLLYAPMVIYLKYRFPWERFNGGSTLLVSFGAFFFYSFIVSFTCLILLEMIEQMERGDRIRLFAATWHVIRFDLLKALPIMLIWATLWWVLVLIEAIVRRRRNGDDEEMTAENVARTLAGVEQFSLSRELFRLISKGLRMVTLLILPAIAWENRPPLAAVKRGIQIVKVRMTEFAIGFVLTDLAAGIVFFPPAILFLITGKADIELPTAVWIATIIYCGFAWSLIIFFEQMYVAELFMWHMAWENEYLHAQSTERVLPQLSDVKRPSVLDELPDLAYTFSTTPKQSA